MNTNTTTHMENAQGQSIPVENISPRDLLCDQLVKGIVSKFEALQQEMAKLKEATYADIASFIEASTEKFGVKCGGAKGNVTLFSFDKKIKVIRSKQDSLTFDERILAAQELITECVKEWTEGSRPELRVIVDRAFRQDKQGNLSTAAVLDLRNLEIDDERWQRAMKAINESLQVVFSRSYVRVLKQNEKGGWDNITLDFAKL